jgi:phosphate uptake regulator
MIKETRKVQRTGKSTLIVSLPKRWATKNEIENGSILFVSQKQNGDLFLSPEISEQDQTAKLEIGDKSGETLVRDVISCYIDGYRTIEITSDQLSAMQKRDIHSIVNKLIGPEVIEESRGKVVIQDLLSPEELLPDRVLKRMKNMTRSMIQDALSTIIKQNNEIAFDVMQRDDDIDRLNLLMARQFTEILKSSSITQEPMNPITVFHFMQAASNLERMADYAAKIAEISTQNDYDQSTATIEGIPEIISIFSNLIDESISIILNADNIRANQLLDRTLELKRQLSIMGGLSGKIDDGMRIRLLVSDSFERILDRINNIAELSINLHIALLEN